jgi:hypothetical protein
MKYGEAEVKLHAFLTSALNGHDRAPSPWHPSDDGWAPKCVPCRKPTPGRQPLANQFTNPANGEFGEAVAYFKILY